MNNYFRLKKKLGSGGCGDIYEGLNILTNTMVAIKVEKNIPSRSYLKQEAFIYDYLHKQKDVETFIPKIYDFFNTNEHNFLVMDMLGPNISELFKKCKKSFSLKTVLMLAIHKLNIIEYIHSKELVHRDIKPNNFLIGLGSQKNKLFLIDFGYTKKFIMENGEHIPTKKYTHLTGTVRYANINNHLFLEQSRRDDLETLGYSLVYLLKGELPWQKIKGPKSEKNQKIKDIKIKTSVEKLCLGIPMEFPEFLNYCKKLEFEELPDYIYLKKLFQNLFDEKGYIFDNKFCWDST